MTGKKAKVYRPEEHEISEREIPRCEVSVWCEACGSGYTLSSDGVRHEHADRHERLIGTPHCWEDPEEPGGIRSCGSNYIRREWNWTERVLSCSSGARVEARYDRHGIYCGRMCEERFLATYRQDDYDVRDYGESLDPE